VNLQNARCNDKNKKKISKYMYLRNLPETGIFSVTCGSIIGRFTVSAFLFHSNNRQLSKKLKMADIIKP
jgi:hypothetical protein